MYDLRCLEHKNVHGESHKPTIMDAIGCMTVWGGATGKADQAAARPMIIGNSQEQIKIND